MFTYFRKFINKWKFNQGIYIEPMSRDVIIPLNKEDKQMELYHVETQEDYNALMVEVEKEGYHWRSGLYATSKELDHWKLHGPETVISAVAEVLGYANIQYYKNEYPDTPIKKYKAKEDKFPEWLDDAANVMKAISAGGASVKNENTDNINNPEHYTSGGIETLDYIKAKVSDYPSYAVGNIVKYVSRYEHKNGIEDLKKAQFYLNDLIEWME
ncbi:DUF3310 domain-containing protein [Listeria monocytogenes]